MMVTENLGLLTFGSSDSDQPELVDGAMIPPTDAQSHLFFLKAQKMSKKQRIQFGSLLIPIQAQESMQTWPLRSGDRLIGLAYPVDNSILIVGSGYMGDMMEYGPIQTDAACFFAAGIGGKMFVHFVKSNNGGCFF